MRSILILAILGVGCGGPTPPQPASLPVPPKELGPEETRILHASLCYEGYGRVDDETRWAPYLCRQPFPGRARVSRPATEHGQKLYTLFARHRNDYVREGGAPQPEGQILVKESWVPREVPQAEADKAMTAAWECRTRNGAWIPYARKDGRAYRATERAGLFIMVKTGGPESEADQGWIYGTVSPEGKVTSAGRVASCMSCHQDAKGDRIFGIAWTE